MLHLSITSSNHHDCTIHKSGTSNHVLDIIGVTRAVDVGIVTGFGLILDVRSCNGDTSLSLFGGFVNSSVLQEGRKAFLGLSLGDGSRKGGL